MSIQKYPTGNVCPHCVWVSDDQKIYKEQGWKNIKIVHTIPAHTTESRDTFCLRGKLHREAGSNFLGMTVVDSHSKFTDTLNCVYGVKGQDSKEYHKSSHVGDILYGATMFIGYLHSEFGITRARLLINSKVDRKKYGGKEHVHALLTLEEPREKVEKFFDLIEEKFDIPKPKITIPIASEPYPEDAIYFLSGKDSRAMINNPKNAVEDIQRFFSPILYRPLNPSIDNFFIFLNYMCFPSGKCVATGVVSADVKKLKREK